MTAPLPSSVARIDADIAAAQHRLVEARAFRTEVDGLRGTARSRDHAVSVTVDASGLVVDLALTDPLPAAHDLRQLLLDTLRAAQQDVATRTRESASERFGASSPIVSRMEEELAARFAERDPDGTSITGADPDLGRGSRWLR